MKYFSTYIINPLRTWNKAKNVFKPLTRYFWFGKTRNIPVMHFTRGKIFDLYSGDVMWKDKYDTPRYEECPRLIITLFNTISFVWYWRYSNVRFEDDYWEQLIWYVNYYDSYGCDKPNIEKAKKKWPWQDINRKSTWNDVYLH